MDYLVGLKNKKENLQLEKEAFLAKLQLRLDFLDELIVEEEGGQDKSTSLKNTPANQLLDGIAAFRSPQLKQTIDAVTELLNRAPDHVLHISQIEPELESTIFVDSEPLSKKYIASTLSRHFKSVRPRSGLWTFKEPNDDDEELAESLVDEDEGVSGIQNSSEAVTETPETPKDGFSWISESVSRPTINSRNRDEQVVEVRHLDAPRTLNELRRRIE